MIKFFRCYFKKALVTSYEYDKDFKFSNSLVYLENQDIFQKILYFTSKKVGSRHEINLHGPTYRYTKVTQNIFKLHVAVEQISIDVRSIEVGFELPNLMVSLAPNNIELH